ncbi:MAG: cupin domain-containing protein [Caldilineaceae bacterium]|nr:cupin domain-containing protein [Caldilineaceae bacterium]
MSEAKSIDEINETDVADSDRGQVVQIGARIRRLRTERNLALRNLAESSGLSINTISLVERNKISPSVSTLHRIAVALDVPITAFFEDATEEQMIIFTPARSRRAIAIPGGHMEKLGSGLAHQCIEPLLIRLEPGASSGRETIMHSGHELIFCVTGNLFYEVDGEQYHLEPGDSLLFEAQLPHRWGNEGTSTVTAIMLFARPDGTEGILQRHIHN